MKLLDTNVIVYALGRPHRYKQPCVRLLQDVADGIEDYGIDTELLQEILYLYTARGERRPGLSTCRDLLSMFPDPFPITRTEITLAHGLMTAHPSLLPSDAIHASVVLTNHLEGIVSADKVFDLVDNVSRFDPLALHPEV